MKKLEILKSLIELNEGLEFNERGFDHIIKDGNIYIEEGVLNLEELEEKGMYEEIQSLIDAIGFINEVKIVFAGAKAITRNEYLELLQREVEDLELENIKEAYETDIDSIFFETVEEYKEWREDKVYNSQIDLVNYSEEVAKII